MDDVWAEFLSTQPKTIQDVFETLNEEQRHLLYYMVGSAIEDERNRIRRLINGDL